MKAAIHQELRAGGEEQIAILGDFNDFSGSAPLQPLLSSTDLRDVSDRPNFTADGLNIRFDSNQQGMTIPWEHCLRPRNVGHNRANALSA